MATLLIADDDRTNRLRLAQVARSLGYHPVLASDGARALAVIEDNPDIACVVTDWQMPVLDGPALIRALRAAGNPVPVLVYSAFRSISEVASLLEQGATGFLPYPVPRETLGEYVERFVFKSRAR
jgi:sigma-B regulation protein RsbU (phosphoserine phosphatase)